MKIESQSKENLMRMAQALKDGKLDTSKMDSEFVKKLQKIADGIPAKELKTTAKLKDKEIPAEVTTTKKGKVTKKHIKEFLEFAEELELNEEETTDSDTESPDTCPNCGNKIGSGKGRGRQMRLRKHLCDNCKNNKSSN